MGRIETVVQYLESKPKWAKEIALLRDIMLSNGLQETIKWNAPTYTFNKKNIVGIGAFKAHMGIWFFQGAMLKDKTKKLFNAQEEKTTAMRQWRFNSVQDIEDQMELIDVYLQEAIANEKKGKKLLPKQNAPIIIPSELEAEFEKLPTLLPAFNALNLTKKREFIAHITSAKREETKAKRIEKYMFN